MGALWGELMAAKMVQMSAAVREYVKGNRMVVNLEKMTASYVAEM